MSNPFGLHTVTPYLVVEGVVDLIRFLENVFDAKTRGEVKYRDDGGVMHAEVQLGDSVVMMGEPMDDMKVMPATLYLYVDDCDARFQAALDAGASEVMKPANHPHGDRYGGVRDPSGNIWWVVTHQGGGSSS